MGKIDTYIDSLSDSGYKVTPQRIEVITALLNLNHPTVGEIEDQVHQRYPRISTSTIYGTLELLKDLNQIQQVTKPSKVHYDVVRKPHPHFICRKCGQVTDIERSELQGLVESVSREVNFSFRRLETNFYGVCNKCQDTE